MYFKYDHSCFTQASADNCDCKEYIISLMPNYEQNCPDCCKPDENTKGNASKSTGKKGDENKEVAEPTNP